ncbi:MAG: autotransporter domain-containing protein, partial [Alphaproteobacteria bacterium]|nr:autotransporter domain-containing protein [Alphaproteobacteria bacterium]
IMPAMASGYTVVPEDEISEVKTISGTFSGLDASTTSGNQSVWFVKGADVTIASGATFDNNKADSGIFSTSSKAPSSLTLNSGVVFENNTVRFDGGAVANYNTLNANGVTFRKNTAQTDFENDTTPMGGGALALGSESQTMIQNSIFSQNESKYHGGAIAMRGPDDGDNSAADLDIIDSEFRGNIAAQNGGAIYSTFYDSENVKDSVYIKGTEFTKNSAERGGAIYTEGKADLGGGLASMKIEGATFTENKAAAEGGAIQNRSSMNITDSVFKDNVANGYYGGALYNAKSGNIETLDADFSGNKTVNEGFAAGGAITNIGKIGELTGMFESNKVDASAEDASSKGGAIYTYAGSSIDSIVADFVGNQAFSGGEAIGGAVVNDGTITKLHQTGQGFVNNVSDGDVDGWAGALYNSETGVISELVANFTGNSVNGAAWAVGGALVNKGTIESLTGTFANNTVAVSAEDGFAAGGAVYNEGTINFDGDVLFSNNTAVEGADIYNDGIVNIVSGTTTIDTAVAGEGTLNVASDAILNIGTATVQQTQINIDGIVQASVLSDRSYGRLLGLIEAKDSAELKLNVGSVGSYKIFDSQADIDVTAGATYDVSQEADGTVVIATKAVEDIATGAGISTQAAGAVAGLANADSGKAHQVSLALQEALNSGDAAFVEAETKKLNPTDKPVAQAAATSVQNQVLALTSGRMAGGISVGRAGGDAVAQENGFWMQGLFNKSKFADAFHGYTRGIALGADTLIDKTWTIGGGLAFNNSDVHADGAHTDIDSKTLFLYGQYKPNKWYVNGTLTYNMSEYTENKTVGGVSVEHEYDVDAYGAQIMTGYDFATGITTEAGLRYLYIDQDSYADGLDRQIMATDTDFLSGVAGVKYAFAIENDWAIQLRPELRAAMTYDLISDDAATTVVMPGAEAYAVNGERLSRMGGEFGIGLTALYKGMELSVMYDLDLHKDYTSQTGMIKFRTQF